MDERKYPPVTQVAMVSLALIIAGGIYLSANLPEHVSLAPAVILLALSALLMAGNLFSLTRVKDFAWERFFAVAKWSLLAYFVIGGDARVRVRPQPRARWHVGGADTFTADLRDPRPSPDGIHGRALLPTGLRVRRESGLAEQAEG